MLPFPDKNVQSKKKAKVKVGNSAWSDEFPLDTAGSAARVICPDENNQYELTVDIQVCQSGLTKIVSFAPFYLVHNDSKFDMQVREPGASEWTLVPSESVRLTYEPLLLLKGNIFRLPDFGQNKKISERLLQQNMQKLMKNLFLFHLLKTSIHLFLLILMFVLFSVRF